MASCHWGLFLAIALCQNAVACLTTVVMFVCTSPKLAVRWWSALAVLRAATFPILKKQAAMSQPDIACVARSVLRLNFSFLHFLTVSAMSIVWLSSSGDLCKLCSWASAYGNSEGGLSWPWETPNHGTSIYHIGWLGQQLLTCVSKMLCSLVFMPPSSSNIDAR